MRPEPVALAPGLIHHPGWLDAGAQTRLAEELRTVLAAAPAYRPTMPGNGRPFSVRMTNAGALGWVSDRAGYRYQPTHPETALPWPAIPPLALAAWTALAGCPAGPEACLVNLYEAGARMGLHQDRDEAELSAPVLSLSLGAAALFRYGGPRRGDPTRSIRLAPGDALVIGGPSRLIHHGIDRLLAPDLHAPGSGDAALLDGIVGPGGRCNLTLRRATPLPSAPRA